MLHYANRRCPHSNSCTTCCYSLISPPPAFTATASQYLAQGLRYRASERYPEAIAAIQKSVQLNLTISGQVILGWTQHLAGKEDAATKTL